MQIEDKSSFRLRINEEALAFALVPAIYVAAILNSYLGFYVALIIATILSVFLYEIGCGIAALWRLLFSREPVQQNSNDAAV